MDTLKDSADYLLALVNDLLDFSAVDSGRVAFKRASCYSPGKLLKSVSLLFEHQAEQKGLTLQTELAENLPEFVMGDENRLRQVLVNLLSNAVKFTPPGGKIVLDGLLLADEGILEFTVSDNGIGIPKDKLDRVFLPFSKAREDDQGTGLGLAICRQIVELMNGSIQLESEGRGCTVQVRLPLDSEDADPDETAGETGAIPTFSV